MIPSVDLTHLAVWKGTSSAGQMVRAARESTAILLRAVLACNPADEDRIWTAILQLVAQLSSPWRAARGLTDPGPIERYQYCRREMQELLVDLGLLLAAGSVLKRLEAINAVGSTDPKQHKQGWSEAPSMDRMADILEDVVVFWTAMARYLDVLNYEYLADEMGRLYHGMVVFSVISHHDSLLCKVAKPCTLLRTPDDDDLYRLWGHRAIPQACAALVRMISSDECSMDPILGVLVYISDYCALEVHCGHELLQNSRMSYWLYNQ